MIATLMLEIFHKSTYSDEYSMELFELLEQTLCKLEKYPQAFLTIEAFKLKLLERVGILPDITSCFGCNKRWTTENRIWIDEQGHLLCQICKLKSVNFSYEIDFETIKLAHYIRTQPTEINQRISLNNEQKKTD